MLYLQLFFIVFPCVTVRMQITTSRCVCVCTLTDKCIHLCPSLHENSPYLYEEKKKGCIRFYFECGLAAYSFVWVRKNLDGSGMRLQKLNCIYIKKKEKKKRKRIYFSICRRQSTHSSLYACLSLSSCNCVSIYYVLVDVNGFRASVWGCICEELPTV